ncbi:MAG: hypothetical protein ACPIOQ_42855 [Promethearchaeia archaeon]
MEHDPSESAARTLKNGLIEGRQFHDTNALLCEIYDNMRPAEKSLVLIFRGTEAGNLKVNIKDVWTDLNGGMRPAKMVHGPGGLKTKGLVHDGFWGSWEEVQSPVSTTVEALLRTDACTSMARVLDHHGHLSRRKLTGADISIEAQYQAGVQPAGAVPCDKLTHASAHASIQCPHFEAPREVLCHRKESLGTQERISGERGPLSGM